jgi:hypothetical protein
MAFRERFKWVVNGTVYSVYWSSATASPPENNRRNRQIGSRASVKIS